MRTAGGRLLRNFAGSLTVLAVILGIAFGLPAINRMVPADLNAVGGKAYLVGGGVSVVPPLHAQVDASKTRPAADRGTVLFLVGPVRYVIVVAPFGGGIEDAAAKLRTKIESTRGYQVAGGEDSINTGSGLKGVGGGYTAPGRIGRYAVFLASGISIEVTVSGTEVGLSDEISAIEQSVASITYQS
ncbi:hypothetical protein F4553_004216 [Allocatelliglobosispora scoriae]|uniref:Uncharacterized protein n=1 Tax=Allocatelliglobosispora scoriae TaxID=643052 RepID=A0A841BP31_9ACTN|nr:hypothetical protein [Allocatelliglobosispora scoriae]MBB5870837.1 hypothetical protein [Allocatelliglobosispora scoriae]